MILGFREGIYSVTPDCLPGGSVIRFSHLGQRD